MAFNDLTSNQRDALIPLIEALLTGKYNEEFFLYRQAGQRQGKIHLTLKIAKSAGQELPGFTESELQAFKEEGYLSTPTDLGAALKIKAYSEYEKYKAQSNPIQSPDPIPTAIPLQRDQVFISYSHKDKNILEELQTTLTPLVRGKKISVWNDNKIKPGDEWREEIKKAIAFAKVAVLLVSRDFIASDFIAEHELPPLLEAARKEGLRILWVAVRPSLYEETEIARYQAVNDPNRPLSKLSGADREEELVRICREIKSAALEGASKAANLVPAKPIELSNKAAGVNIETNSKVGSPAHLPTSEFDNELDETATRILAFLAEPQHQNVYAVEIVNSLGLPQTLVKSYLDKLAEEGYVLISHDSRTNSEVCTITTKGKKFLNKPVRTIPFPSGHDELDPPKIKILQLLADETIPPFMDSLSITLEIYQVHLKEHLDVLIERGWVTANEFDEWYAAKFRLTRKARQFLINNDLIK